MAKRRQVLERFHSIADMMDQAVAAGCTPDETEDQAIKQVWQLGWELLGDWVQVPLLEPAHTVCSRI